MSAFFICKVKRKLASLMYHIRSQAPHAFRLFYLILGQSRSHSCPIMLILAACVDFRAWVHSVVTSELLGVVVLDTLARNACGPLPHRAICDLCGGTSDSCAETQCRICLHEVGELFWLDQSVYIFQHGTDDTYLGICRYVVDSHGRPIIFEAES